MAAKSSKFNIFLLIAIIIVVVLIALLVATIFIRNNPQNQQPPNTELSGEMNYEPAPGDVMKTLIINLEAQNNSGQIGYAKIAESPGNKTRIQIEVLAEGINNPQPAHIHTGKCPTPGAVKYPLTNVQNGKSDTTIDVNIDQLVSQGQLAINIHKSAEEAQVYTACGDIPVINN